MHPYPNPRVKPAPPPLPSSAPSRDMTAQTAQITAANPVDLAFRQDFTRRRIGQLRDHPELDEPNRITMAQALAKRLHGAISLDDGQPVPGGLGDGFYYYQPFREAWTLGTSMACDYVCPHRAGGNSQNLLYLTSMNRAAWGCEPLVRYHAQKTPEFVVFDWALANQGKDPWAVNRPFALLADYLATATANTGNWTVLPMCNSTFVNAEELDDGEPNLHWRNTVHLLNHVTGTWDLQYLYDYVTTEANQKPRAIGEAWGPIIETFQPRYFDTNKMGALNTQLHAENGAGVWSTWAPLAPGEAHMRYGNNGFEIDFRVPESSFIASA